MSFNSLSNWPGGNKVDTASGDEEDPASDIMQAGKCNHQDDNEHSETGPGKKPARETTWC